MVFDRQWSLAVAFPQISERDLLREDGADLRDGFLASLLFVRFGLLLLAGQLNWAC